MRRLRFLLIPFGVVLELVLFAACWAMLRINLVVGKRMTLWAESVLPDRCWYMGGRS